MFNVTVTNNISPQKIAKSIRFGVARGFTLTAKAAQSAVQVVAAKKLNKKGSGNWFQAQSRIGIRITPATPEKQESEVKTAAYFGKLQDEGGVKLPFSRTHLAIPAKGGPVYGKVRIPDNLRPKALVASGKAWIEKTENGTLLLVTHGLAAKGRYKGNILWYILVAKAKIKRTDFFYDTIQKVVDEKLASTVAKSIQDALGDIR